jgi:hypothetical protein
MKIMLENWGTRYTVETEQEDYRSDELKDMFNRLLVQAGYPPSVITLHEDDGSYEYVGSDEVIVKKEVKNDSKRRLEKDANR